MKPAFITAAIFLLAGVPAMAQTTAAPLPNTTHQGNSTVLGTESAPGNSSGAPSALTPQGEIATTQVTPSQASPAAPEAPK